MGKIKVIKKSTLSGKTEADDYKIYPVTKTEAVFTDKEDVDAADSTTPQGANKTVKEILNSVRSKGWVNTARLKDKSVTTEKLADEAVTTDKVADKAITGKKIADKTIDGSKLADHSITKAALGGDALSELEDTTQALDDVVFHENENDSEVPIPTGETLESDLVLDTEDFQIDDKKVQLANRDNTLGMGYKILRPHHIVEDRPKVILTARSKAYYSGMLHVTFDNVQYHVELTENDDAATVMSKIYAVLNEALATDYLLTLEDNVITILKRDNTAIADCVIDNADTDADVHVENTTEHINIYSIGQSDFNRENTIYEVRYNFDLDNKEITIPANCSLNFRGGSFKNGRILGSGTTISSSKNEIFDKVLLDGSWNIDNLYINFFKNSSDNDWIVDSICNIINNEKSSISKLLFTKGEIYTFRSGFYFKNNIIIEGNDSTVIFTDCSYDYIGFQISKYARKNHPKGIEDFEKVSSGNVSASKNTNVINASTSNVNIGDIVIIANSEDNSFSPSRTYYKQGDMFKVTSVTTNSLEVSELLTEDYTGDSISLYKLNTVETIVRNITIKTESDESHTIIPLLIYGATNSLIYNVKALGSWNVNIGISLSYNCLIDSCFVDYDYTHDSKSVTSLRYGIVIGHSKFITASHNYLKSGRHGLAIGNGAYSDLYIVSRYIVVENNVIATYGYSHQRALDCHGNAEYIIFRNNTVFDGIDVAAKNSYVIGNIIQFGQYSSSGLTLMESNSFYVENNIFRNDVSDNAAIILSSANDYESGKIYIIGNHFETSHKGGFISCNPNTAKIVNIYKNYVVTNGAFLSLQNGASNTVNVYNNIILSQLITCNNNTVIDLTMVGNYVYFENNTIYIHSGSTVNILNNTFKYDWIGLRLYSADTERIDITANICNNRFYNTLVDSTHSHDVLYLRNVNKINFAENTIINDYDKTILYYIDNSVLIAKNNNYYGGTSNHTIANNGSIQEEFVGASYTSTTRPIPINVGYSIFDTTLNKPIYWTGTTWVDATGTEV